MILGLYESDENEISLWTVENKRFDHIQTFTFDNGYNDATFPIVFHAQLSQTKSYKFWITHGPEKVLGEPIHIRENIVLKTFSLIN